MTVAERSSFGFGDVDQVMVERAVAELRAGRPVILHEAERRLFALPADALEPDSAGLVGTWIGNRARLVLSAARLRHMGIALGGPGLIALPVVDPARVEQLTMAPDARIGAPVGPADPLETAALTLTQLSLLLPAVIVASWSEVPPDAPPLLDVAAEAVRRFKLHRGTEMRVVARTSVPLEGAPVAELVLFRGGEGLGDQLAIIVGTPDLSEAVPLRLHSACLTGDLLGSLKCDCGDQLRGAMRRLAELGGGILLYLDQEGRGIGLANKLRAYGLQARGRDTYEADEVLGFEPDQRRFDFAAAMLRALGVGRVSLLTNNPEKIEGLQVAGIEVVSDERLLGRVGLDNLNYLAVKRDRAGHLLDLTASPRSPSRPLD